MRRQFPARDRGGAVLRTDVLTETESANTRRVPAAALRAFLIDALRACDLNEADAATVAGAMLEADLTGSDAHGVFRLPGYVKALKRAAMNPRANIRVLERGPARALTYAAIPLRHGMVGVYGAASSVNPWGGSEPLLGTNPIAVTILAGNEPLGARA